MPWIQVPQATIAFKGTARVIDAVDVDDSILDALGSATAHEGLSLEQLSIIEVTPAGHFITYGVGVTLLDMRDPKRARGRVAVDYH